MANNKNTTCNVNIMMFGGRRCGKTSILAAMKKCADETFGENSSLTVTYNSIQLDTLEKKESEIKKFLSGDNLFVPDEGDSKDESSYYYDISLVGKGGQPIRMTFYDYPGEWLNNPSRQQRLNELVNRSNIFIIAIDTPYLMEEPESADQNKIGRFNQNHNRSSLVCNKIKEVLNAKETPNEFPPLIMFVPLKCEKYYNAGNMKEVNQKIHAAYKTLFDFFGNKDNHGKYEVVIMPILTFGENTAEFSRFDFDEKGEIILTEAGLPQTTWYIHKIANPVYSPLYCEQPLLYSLEYLLHMAYKQKDKNFRKGNWFTKFFQKMFEGFFNLPSSDDFLKQEYVIRKKLMKDDIENGFEIVHNPMKL
jgi:hypothetical protein